MEMNSFFKGIAAGTLMILLLFIGTYDAQANTLVSNTREIQGFRVTYVSVDLDETWDVHGFTAQQLFGRPTATLREFHDATSHMHGSDVLIFPVNFFNTGSDFSIVGGIFSHGTLLYPPPTGTRHDWVNPGAGFDPVGRFQLFSGRLQNYGRYVSPGMFSAGPLANYTIIEMAAVFGPFPHLIENGTRLDVQPMPGFSAEQINNRLMRAFMGQRADDTFIVANVPSASIPQLQDLAGHFNLINATNIDGGASASIMLNGNIITSPGRQLASVAVITRTGGQAEALPRNLDTASGWAHSSINRAIDLGIVPPGLQNHYRNNITRAEFAALAVALYETVTGREIAIDRSIAFNDTADINVHKAAAIGVISGVGNNNFNPGGTLTRQQAASILADLAAAAGHPLPAAEPAFADNHRISSWARSRVGQIAAAGIMTGSGGSFNPDGTFTRQESITAVLSLFDYLGR